MWRAFVYVPALAIGFLAMGKPVLLSGAAYVVCVVVFSFNGHGPYGFEDSLVSLVIVGEVHHFLHPSTNHGKLVLYYLRQGGMEIAPPRYWHCWGIGSDVV